MVTCRKFFTEVLQFPQPNTPDIPHCTLFKNLILFMCQVQLDFYLRPDKSFNSHSAHTPLKSSRTRLKLLAVSEFCWKASWNGRIMLAAVSNAESSVWILNFHNFHCFLETLQLLETNIDFQSQCMMYHAYYFNKSSLSHVNMHISIKKSI